MRYAWLGLLVLLWAISMVLFLWTEGTSRRVGYGIGAIFVSLILAEAAWRRFANRNAKPS